MNRVNHMIMMHIKSAKHLKSIILTVFMLACFYTLRADNIKLGLYFGKKVSAVVLSVTEGEYIIYGDYRQVGIARKGLIFHIENAGHGLTIQDTLRILGTFSRIEFKGISHENVFRIRPVSPSLPPKESDDNLLLSQEGHSLRIINILDLEKYIAGTVETEGGPNAHPEFYKAQCILARTFAVKNFYRHGTEGYNLCDTEHCQAYKGKSRMNPEIQAAARATKGLVLMDRYNHLVNPLYHSNCGGMTSDAARVWGKPLPYLQPVTDPFCRNSRNATWKAILSRSEWINYLVSKGFNKRLLQQSDFTCNPAVREKYYRIGERQVELTEIRKDLGLKSTFFSITTEEGQVVLHGRGYGHGVGMCQEGAMEMAKKGYVYVDILHFYFTNVRICQMHENK
ncbi:MAG: SpoIID/LytB domain-containing protein [Bacteroidales bacterium]|nr:SpoIID/LytB domain-containing protein [Bacteroidales bacterium]MBN2762662.1 SpoIID/LytB domain-containing protein [Bacteroidales bacterium]